MFYCIQKFNSLSSRMSNFPRNTNQEFIENVFTCYKMFLLHFFEKLLLSSTHSSQIKTIERKCCLEKAYSHFIWSWLSLKFNLNHCSSSLHSMLKCVTRKILNLMLSCESKNFKKNVFNTQSFFLVVIHTVVANLSEHNSFSPSILFKPRIHTFNVFSFKMDVLCSYTSSYILL